MAPPSAVPLLAIAPAPDPDPDPDIRVSALSHHLPTPILANTFQHGVSFLCGKHLFNTLFDTGATNSIVDPLVIPILHLQSQVIAPADPVSVITLANGSTVPCMGSVRVRFTPVTVLPTPALSGSGSGWIFASVITGMYALI